MSPDHEGGCDQPDDPKKVAKRREQNRLAKKRPREKQRQRQDQVRNEGKAGEEKEQERGDLAKRAARSGPRFAPLGFLLLAGYEDLTAPLFALSDNNAQLK
jgi:hypothetical protein